MIAFFSRNNIEMLDCKSGAWYETNPQRARSNNSAVLLREGSVSEYDTSPTKEELDSIWERIKNSGSGEPGIYWTNSLEVLSNPCGEIALSPNQFCNLTTINGSAIKTQQEFVKCSVAASFISTLQAGYTDFHYLRDIWHETTKKEALLGVSITGIASNTFSELDHEAAAEAAVKENIRVSSAIGINPAARITCIKPEGTTSLVLGTSSGIHAWHSQYYIRRMRINKQEPIHDYLVKQVPELIEDDQFKPELESVLSIPVRSPADAITRDETAIQFLERVANITERWIKPGHRSGINTHNVSATVNIREDEWYPVRDWMWENRALYSGLSVLPHSDHTYIQAPFEACDELTYNRLSQSLQEIDLSEIIEDTDETSLAENLACAGGACTI
jgi:ribonucleoside-diphosphate reductase alpha chain